MVATGTTRRALLLALSAILICGPNLAAASSARPAEPPAPDLSTISDRLSDEASVPQASHVLAGHETFQDGDLLMSTYGPPQAIQWRLPDGTLNLSIGTPIGGGIGFGADGSLYLTEFQHWQRIQKYDTGGDLLATYELDSCQDPATVVADSQGNLYFGSGANLNCTYSYITKFDAADNFVANFDPVDDQPGWERGPGWIAIEGDDCTVRYGTQGPTVRRYDVCTDTQLTSFSNSLTTARGMIILPDGGMVVANRLNVVRLNASGQVVRTFDAPGEDDWYAVALDLDNDSFWASTFDHGTVYRFDASDGTLLSSFDTGTSGVPGIAVYRSDRYLPPSLPDERTLGGPSGAQHGARPFNFVAEPVNTATGAYVSEVTDLSYPGRGPGFAFTRTYNSFETSIGAIGPGWTHSYAVRLESDPDGSVTFVDEGGARLTFAADGSGGFVPPLGSGSTLAPGGGEGFDLTRRDQVVYSFDASGQLTSLVDRNGNALSFTYASGVLAQITDTVGRQITLTHTNGLLTGISGPQSLSVSYGYDPNGRLASVTDVRGKLWSYTYDTSGRLETIVDPNTHTVVTNVYGPGGRVIEQVDARGYHSTYAWDAVTGTSTFTDARGGEWVDVYHDNVLVSQTDPLGSQTRYVYDDDLNLVLVTDPRGNATAMSYDANRNLIRRAAPGALGYDAEQWTYTARNDIETYTDGRGNTTSYEYDTAGNLIRTTAPLSAVTEYGRDPAGTGLLTSRTDPRDKVTTYGFDAEANLTSATTPLGHETTMTYDAAGRMLTLVEPRGNASGVNPADYTTTFTYDPAGNVLTTTDPLGNVTSKTYDPVGNPLSVTNANQRTTIWAYDAANHLTSVTDAKSGVTAYTYDEVGNRAARTDANQHITTYAYDLAGRLTSTTDPLSNDWSTTHDAAGNVATQTDANGNTATFVYDALNRLTTITYADTSTPTTTFAYDANGNQTSMVDGAGTETRTYDELNRLTAVTRGTATFSYGYDVASNLTSRTYPGQTAQAFTYDDDGRLTSASGATYGYDPAANLLTAATPDGLTARYTWDRAGRLLEVAHTTASATLSRFTYGHDPAGNRVAMTTRHGAVTYRYDELDRLIEACWSQTSCPGGAPATPLPCLQCISGTVSRPAAGTNPPAGETYRTYTYDPVGNRLTEASNAGTTSYAYNAADRMTSVIPPGQGPIAYTYDANGNQLSGGGATYTYDLADRLKTATVSGTTETYTYAGDSTRLSASTGSQANKTTKYLWDRAFGLPQLALERNGNDALLRSYRYGLDLLSQAAGSKTYWYHHDGLGSVVDITNNSGTSVSWSEYYPYGLVRHQGQAGGGNGAPAGQTFVFAGEQLDSLTGVYHLRARQYDPGTGRFLTTDPVAPPINGPYVGAYAYAQGNPVIHTDPSGLCVPAAVPVAALAGAPAGGVGAVVTGGAAALCALGVGIATLLFVDAASQIEIEPVRFRDSEPTYDPRPDPETVRRHLELERQLYSGHGGSFGPGGLPSWCAQHRVRCAAYIGVTVATIDAIIIAAGHGRRYSDPVPAPATGGK
jgi:RHS repeat-associated protein